MITLALLCAGCGGLLSKNAGVIGKSSRLEEKAQHRYEQVVEEINNNEQEKLNTIGFFARGAEYALSKVVEPSNETTIAREFNARIVNLTDSPDLDQLKKVHGMVDDLVSSVGELQQRGLKELKKQDNVVIDIQQRSTLLTEYKEQEISNYMKIAEKAASKADQYAETLDGMNSFWGLGAVFYGIKTLFTKAFIFFSIFAFLYLALRVLATIHPAAAAAFHIFDLIGSAFIRIIRGLAPGAAKVAKLVPEATTVLYKNTLGQVVGTIETIKERDSGGDQLKKYTLAEILAEFSKSMDRENKNVVTEVKKELKH